MNYIIFDLEATCWDKNEPVPGPNEIIEIGAIKLNDEGDEVDRLEQFVKPTHYLQLSSFCTELTSITQDMIENAPGFQKAIQIFRDWIGYEDDFILCSWGDYDRKQLVREAEMHGLQFSWFEKHINLKEQYTRIKNIKHQKSLSKALVIEKMELDGTHHRGIDDAFNIAKIFRRYIGHWGIKRKEKEKINGIEVYNINCPHCENVFKGRFAYPSFTGADGRYCSKCSNLMIWVPGESSGNQFCECGGNFNSFELKCPSCAEIIDNAEKQLAAQFYIVTKAQNPDKPTKEEVDSWYDDLLKVNAIGRNDYFIQLEKLYAKDERTGEWRYFKSFEK